MRVPFLVAAAASLAAGLVSAAWATPGEAGLSPMAADPQAGYSAAEVEAVKPLLKAADVHNALERQLMAGPPPGTAPTNATGTANAWKPARP